MEIMDQLISKTKNWLEKHSFKNEEKVGLRFIDRSEEKLRDGSIKDVYVVWFKFEDYVTYDENGNIDIFIEGSYADAFYDAESLELLYVLKNHGYIEPDGS